MALDVKKTFAALRQNYVDDPRHQTFNALICGEMGTGKTHLLKTARKPVLLHAFDPGGEITLREEIENGQVIAQRFGPDDPFRPWAYKKWSDVFNQQIRDGLFDHVGTYCLDSTTMWAEAILNYMTAKRNAAGQTPDGKIDYLPQKTEIKNWISRILSLPCDVIVTGHLEPKEDAVTKRITYRYATTGKGSFIIPAQFDEVYVALSEEGPKGVSYKLQTAGAGRYAARSRLASGGRLETYEDPDIKNILKKVGFPYEDKPLFSD